MSLYILEFQPKFRHAQYYFGYCRDGNFNQRFAQHISGQGAKIVRRAIEAGCTVHPVLICAGNKADETRLKKWENNGRVLKYLIKRVKNEQ